VHPHSVDPHAAVRRLVEAFDVLDLRSSWNFSPGRVGVNFGWRPKLAMILPNTAAGPDQWLLSTMFCYLSDRLIIDISGPELHEDEKSKQQATGDKLHISPT
jgi:hypothetical protein